jgi:thioredoxin reductase (NADPH)
VERTEILIVGAGPIGLELAVALRHADVDLIHVDAGQIGQTVSWYPRQARFFSSPERIAIAGVPLMTADQSKATREEYLAYLRGVVKQFDLHVRTFERVVGVGRDAETGDFLVRTQRGEEEHLYAARYVVLAVGDMHHPRQLGIPGEDLDHVSHHFDEPHRYFQQKLLVVGGRNSAVEAALRCHHAGARVTIAYRQPEFDRQAIKYWLLPELESLIKHDQIRFLPRVVPTRITRQVVSLRSSIDRDGGSPPSWDEPFDFVLLLTGYVQDTALFDMAGVELVGENRAPKLDPQTMQTNVPGLFIAGTAAAGTQVRFRLFIENCHHHVTRIVRAITGREPDPTLINQAAAQFGLPES